MKSLTVFFALSYCAANSFAFHAGSFLSRGRFSSRAHDAASINLPGRCRVGQTCLYASPDAPQVFATGYSPKLDLLEAVQEATANALQALPKAGENASIDLAIIAVSSLYDGQSPPSVVVPAVLRSAAIYGGGIQNLIGSTVGGIISSIANLEMPSTADETVQHRACTPVESEGVPGVSVTLCLLPDVRVKTFHILSDDVPDEVGRISQGTWKQAVGLGSFHDKIQNEPSSDPPAFMLIPSPAFQNDLDDLLRGLQYAFPSSTTFGGVASTVSSLTRARLFRYDASDSQCIQTLADGCVGVALEGDIVVRTMIAQGAKPVGGIYRVVSGKDSTIGAIVLDEAAAEDETADSDGDNTEDQDAKATLAAAYAKARIPKPVLAEANFVMKSLSDDDQSFMRKALLVGLERGGPIGRSPNELAMLAEGRGHRFMVHQVATAGMKDGSVTLPLGRVDIQPGTRMRFFVRESDFAKKEVEALWMGYKKRSLDHSFQGGDGCGTFTPTACMLVSTLDRGTKFFNGKPGFECGVISQFIPTVPCVSGYFSNGVLGRLDDNETGAPDTVVHGSASSYVLVASKSNRPVFSPATAAAEEKSKAVSKAEQEAAEVAMVAEDEKRKLRARSPVELDKRAPRSINGELILKRREVHSGRAISVSTVEWSVAEKTAMPTSVLEGFMWDKETEVDRFRERVPLSNLVSQCRLSAADPTMPKPRDWIGSLRSAISSGSFVIIPECKRIEPFTGSLRKRYDLAKLVKQFTLANVPAICVNCDGVLFGGSLEDVTKAREVAAAAALESSTDDGVVVPPVLASDLILYPYQLYKLRLAGADAVNLVCGALASKDVMYLTKIASSLQLQTLITVTSTVQIESLMELAKGSVRGLILSNRELEDFSFDLSGDQALNLLRSDALSTFRAKHGDDVVVLVEGRVGIINRSEATGRSTALQYLAELKAAGASGAIVGGGLAIGQSDDATDNLSALLNGC